MSHLCRFFIFIIFTFLLSACGATRSVSSSSSKSSNATVNKVVKEAESYLGTRYKYGGTNKRGIDCSALVQNSFSAANVSLPRITRDQANNGVSVKLRNVKVGDVLFFNTSGKGISHAGIVENIKNGEIFFIHASSSKGVMVSSLENVYWKPRFVKAKRFLK